MKQNAKYATVILNGDEVKKCKEFAQQSWLNKKMKENANQWNVGLVPDNIIIGLLGEFGFAKYFNLEMDFNYSEKGIPWDFILKTRKIDVKTTKQGNYGHNLILRAKQNYHVFELESDIYFLCHLIHYDDTGATVELIGWKNKKNIEKLEMKKSYIGDHMIYEVLKDDLYDLEYFKKVLGLGEEK
jgi:hypothetical protein